MKKKTLVTILSALLVAMIFLMASCESAYENSTSQETEQSEGADKTATSSESEQLESTSYDVEVYSDRRLSITLTEICSDQIIFSVSNTSDSSFSLSLDIALDGQVIPGYSGSHDFEPGETADFVWHCTIENTSHKDLSMAGVVFIDNSSVDFSVCDFDIGGEAHEENDYESGTVLYSSDNITVEFLEPDSTGLNIKIINHSDKETSPFFDSLYINGDESIDYKGYTCTVPPHSTYIFHIKTLNKNNDYFPSDVEYISGYVKFKTRGEGYTDEFDFDSRSSQPSEEETIDNNTVSDEENDLLDQTEETSSESTEKDSGDNDETASTENTKIDEIMERFAEDWYKTPTISSSELNGIMTYSVLTSDNGSYYISYTQSEDGTNFIEIAPVKLDETVGASDWMTVIGHMVYAVDTDMTLVYEGMSVCSQVLEDGSVEKNGIKYSINDENMYFTIEF